MKMKGLFPTLGVAAAFMVAAYLAAPADAAPVRHSDLGPTNGIHVIQNWAPANTAALSALSVTSDDIGKIARQVDTGEYFVLTNNVGPVWTKVPGLNHTATSVVGRSAGTAGGWADIAASTDNRVLARSSGSLAFSQVATAMIASNAVDDAALRQSAALSIIGRASNSTGNVADISAGSNDTLLRRTSNALSFGQITVGMIPDGIITQGKLTGVLKVSAYSGRANAFVNTASVTSYAAPIGRNEGISITTTIADGQMLWNQSGTLKNFRARCLTSSGNANTFSLFLNVNGSNSAVTLAGMAGSDTTLHSDLTHTAAISAGDLLTIAKVNDGSSTLTDDVVWSFDFESAL